MEERRGARRGTLFVILNILHFCPVPSQSPADSWCVSALQVRVCAAAEPRAGEHQRDRHAGNSVRRETEN